MGSVVEFEMAGVPRNFTNQRIHWAVLWQEKQRWWDTTVLLGRAARKAAGWPVAQPGEPRQVEITCYRVRPIDDDGGVIACKSIRDGLQVETLGKSEKLGKRRLAVAKLGAGLISSDGDPAVTVVVKQVKVAHFKEQRVVVKVHAEPWQ